MVIGVTGASGFLGSWLCNILSKENQIVGYVRPTSNTKRLIPSPSLKIKTTAPDMPEAFNEEGIEILLMLDWDGVGNQFRNTPHQFQNLTRQKRIISNAAHFGVRKVIGFGSQAELGPLKVSASENLPDSPTTAYGEAKVLSRVQHIQICEDLGLEWAWCRIFSTYGPKDSRDWLISGALASLERNEEVQLTKCEQVWSYLHVLDFVKAIQALLPHKLNVIAHIGNPNTVKLLEVIEIIGELTGKRSLLNVGSLPYRPDQVMLMQPICGVLDNFDWTPRVNLKEGIKHMLATNKSNSPSILRLIDGSSILI
jgi:nucleoside-diphosphate-sugar epimerase